MPAQDAILCNDCSLLFTAAPSNVNTIAVPQSHRLHQLLFSTDLDRAESLANECNFCSVLVSMRSRSNKLLEDSSKSTAGPQTQDISLCVLGGLSGDDYGTINIFTGTSWWIQRLFQNSGLVLFRPTDSRISTLHELDPDSRTTSSNTTFATLAKWIGTCEEKHHLCYAPTRTLESEAQRWLPGRLIQIGSSSVRVIQTAEHLLTANNRYTTLSYCWGPPPTTFARLLRGNIETMKAGFDVTTLPKTFQDAIRATSLLGMNLIWIDALCIIQDSDNDWQIESMQMSEVYSRAHVNLAADASVDAHGGLFRARNPFAVNPFVLKLNRPRFEGSESFCCVPEDPWIGAVRDSPLFTRAWTFQERLLSARTVYFAEEQLYWECGELCASEIFPLGSPFDPGPVHGEKSVHRPRRLLGDSYDRSSGRIKNEFASLKSWEGFGSDSPEFLELWALLVEDYSKGRLTFPRDRLVAINGVARQLSDHDTEKNYYFGLWRQHFCHLLLWKDLGRADTSECHHSSRPSGLRPSWSWSSHMNPVDYSAILAIHGSLHYPQICAEVLDIDATPGTTRFTQDEPECGRLVIRGPLIKAKLSKFRIIWNPLGPLSRTFYKPLRGKFGKAYREWTPFWFAQEYVLLFPGQGMKTSYHGARMDSGVEIGAHSDVFCVKLANAGERHPSRHNVTSFGLILSHTGKRGQYRRVGCFEVRDRDLTRSWRADRSLWQLRFRSLNSLKGRLFELGDLEPDFYLESDGVES